MIRSELELVTELTDTAHHRSLKSERPQLQTVTKPKPFYLEIRGRIEPARFRRALRSIRKRLPPTSECRSRHFAKRCADLRWKAS